MCLGRCWKAGFVMCRRDSQEARSIKQNRIGYFLLAWLLVTVTVSADDKTFFIQSVEPILKKHCYECHSHSSGVMEGDLTLDWRSGWKTGGGRGAAVVPGDPDASLLIQAVRHSDPDLQMPDEKISDKEIAILTKWVKEGAHDPRAAKPTVGASDATDWWSLEPLKRPAVPGDGSVNGVDAFIQTRLQKEKLQPSSEADRRTLIRRLTYDLHGLMPTVAETNAFISDKSATAYASLLKRLLDSPRYGERWARHWLDTVHFADSHGFEHDELRPNAWRYRDYVIDRFNRDTPWSQFIREQLAADYFYPESTELTVALGFLGAGPYDRSAAATAPKSFEYLDRDDLVTQTMGAFASTTANCARCHTHKFDPVTQADYFALQAVFAGIGKGDVSFDIDNKIGAQRRRWKSLKEAAETQSARLLLKPENMKLVAEWEKTRVSKPYWSPLKADVFLSTNGATLKRNDDGSILSSGKLPEQETIVVTAGTSLSKVTAVRLDVLADKTLPFKGPGRTHNGNLHLTEFELRAFKKNSKEGKVVPIREATADFNQEGWTIQHAIDGNLKTAWGIYPKVGVDHYAVFELKTPLAIEPGTRLVLTLKQLHGGSHIIGKFKLAVTDAAKLNVIALPAEAELVLAVPQNKRTSEQQALLASAVLKYRAEQELKKLPAPVKVYAAASEAVNERGMIKYATPREIRLLVRGDLAKPRAVVAPGALTALAPLPARFDLPKSHQEAARRAALADWLADSRNPLTWRSIANRVWQYHFGTPLVDTPNDFGFAGNAPTHPQLLDWLATELQQNGGSLKALHRAIVTSATYQQASAHRPDAAQLDAGNRWLWRMNRSRLDAESFRDSLLQLSGTLDNRMGGPSDRHFNQSKGVHVTPVVDYQGFDVDDRSNFRRSVYRFIFRTVPDPFMEALDCPDGAQLSPQRGESITAVQTLATMNNKFVARQCELMAARIQARCAGTHNQVAEAFRIVNCRDASPEELSSVSDYVERFGLANACRLLVNTNEFMFVD